MNLSAFFKLEQHRTNVKTEVVAGITTFMTMAYIIAVNPDILSAAGMDKGALFTATCIGAAFATILMGLYANYPFALASGMGLNAFFAFTVVGQYKISWQVALTAVFIEGLIFILLSMVKVREAIVNSIPLNLKYAVSVGIGLFIAFIGFANARIVVANENTMVALGSMKDPAVLIAFAGLVIIGLLTIFRVKGALLWGILASTIIAWIYGYGIGAEAAAALGIYLPTGIVSMPPSIAPIFGKISFEGIFNFGFLSVLFAFLFVDIFDTVGTLVGVASKADMLDEKGNLPNASKPLLVDAIGTTVGALLGISTVTTYVESSAGVAEGGRTGLTSVVTGLLFLAALVFSPIFTSIPSAATAPALIIVGLFMMEPVLKINFTDYSEAVPAFLTIILMPLTYSIADGIIFGMLSYVVLKMLSGKFKDISLTMYILVIVFIIRLAV